MGKKSKSKSFPSFSGGSVSVNGRDVATTSSKNGVVSTNYNMSDTEKNIYDSIQDNMYNSLGNLFSISDQQRKEWSNQLNALKQRGVQQINDIYTPMQTNLRNDIASRFGNLDNSVFMDNLNSITDKKAQAVADLSNNIALTQDSLYSNELNNRMNILTLLSNLNSAMNNNMVNYINAAKGNTTNGNSYNNMAYNAMNSNNGNNLWNSAADAISKIGNSIASYI